MEQATRAQVEEESSLYRYRTTTHVISPTEEGEVNDKVVRDIFPVYDDEFTNLSWEGDGESKREEMEDVEVVPVICQFTPSEMKEVFDLHQQLFAQKSRSRSSPHSDILRSKYTFAASLAQIVGRIPGNVWLDAICNIHGSYSGLSTDYCLSGAHAKMCHDVLTELTQEPQKNQR